MLILNSLEEIKTYLNDFFKLSKPVVLINEISITNKTTLLTQQLFFEATVTLPQKEQEYFQVFSKINNYINECGYNTIFIKGQIQSGGFLFKIIIDNRTPPLYPVGSQVSFQSCPSATQSKFIVTTVNWDIASKEYTYNITDNEGTAFNSVLEHTFES